MDLLSWQETATTDIDTNRLAQCESVIERGLHTFVDVGNALLEIRDRRLYRDSYSTFEDYCRERWGMVRQHANRLIAAAETVSNLEPIGSILPLTESQTRPLTILEPELQVEAWQRAVETAPETGITAKHVQNVVDEIQNKPHVSFNSGNNEWYTPVEYIEAANSVMGGIDLDPASSDIANQVVCATVYFTAEKDGLHYPWHGRVWMNPPYASELIGKFCEKLIAHFSKHEVTEAIVLVNNSTETQWFQTLLEYSSAVCFIKKRVKFLDPEGNPGAPLQGQAVLYLGDHTDLFEKNFSDFGKVLFA